MTNTRLAAAIAALTLMLAGCDTDGNTGEIQRWGGLASDLRFTWDAEPGIDVLTGASVPVRAFIESMQLAQFNGDMQYAYPGFTKAVPKDIPGETLWSRRPFLDGALTKPLVGTNHYYILGFSTRDHEVTATICSFNYAVATEQSNGKFTSAGRAGVGDSRGVDTLRVALTAPDDASILPPQAGPDPAPTEDVFGNWGVTGLLTSFSARKPGFDTTWPTYRADVATCVQKAPDGVERRNFLIDGEHPRSDFPTSAPSPGWPEPSE